MKKFIAALGLVLSVVLLGSVNTIVPNIGIIALIAFGGPAALFLGVGALLFQFALGFLVQSGLSPIELLVGL